MTLGLEKGKSGLSQDRKDYQTNADPRLHTAILGFGEQLLKQSPYP
ncbi:MAG TPA: hypothetical protein VJ835_05680 [Fimbriimonadaceae bacterium]|nr:hypothetical protein [Fimbriimonadaceae bacterium]